MNGAVLLLVQEALIAAGALQALAEGRPDMKQIAADLIEAVTVVTDQIAERGPK